ncbi:hypothetical protein Ddye_002150 [Dipteronia dyeriana]|uniref:RNase H type-1 domain-containing protein n=1 Tax=Dipteronia dyeriana TaxID=168575 RepID=A0AAD9XQG7_9ROSI|nr:hypothetical protein Ddye_002150 [Dipteronia dyeriana]
MVPITILVENLEISCIDDNTVKSNKSQVWSPPQKDELKFNVDGSVTGDHTRAGIGGVLRNFKSESVLSFFASVSPCKANTTELPAIHKVCVLCINSDRLIRKRIVFISDAREVVSWGNDEGLGNLKHLDLIYDIRVMLGGLGNASLIFNSRTTNSVADRLAKQDPSSYGETIV